VKQFVEFSAYYPIKLACKNWEDLVNRRKQLTLYRTNKRKLSIHSRTQAYLDIRNRDPGAIQNLPECNATFMKNWFSSKSNLCHALWIYKNLSIALYHSIQPMLLAVTSTSPCTHNGSNHQELFHGKKVKWFKQESAAEIGRLLTVRRNDKFSLQKKSSSHH